MDENAIKIIVFYMRQGNMIRAYRERLGLGKKALAELLQIDPNSLRIWEAEKKYINRKSGGCLATFL